MARIHGGRRIRAARGVVAAGMGMADGRAVRPPAGVDARRRRMAGRPVRPRRAARPHAARPARLVVRGGRVRPLGGQAVADRARVGEGGRVGSGAPDRARLALGRRAAGPGSRQPRRANLRPGARRRVSPRSVLLRVPPDDRRRLGVDVERVPSLPRIRCVSVSRVLRSPFRKGIPRPSRRLVGHGADRREELIPELGPPRAPADLRRASLRARRVTPGELVDRLSALPVAIDGLRVERGALAVAGYYAEARPTGFAALRGHELTGRGECVAWTSAEQAEFAAACDWLDLPRGSTLGEIVALLASDLDDPYHRAAVEGAAIDLALRQANTNPFAVAGLPARPVAFCRSI